MPGADVEIFSPSTSSRPFLSLFSVSRARPKSWFYLSGEREKDDSVDTQRSKVVLSPLPVNGKTWQKLNLFRASGIDRDQYALSIFNRHFGATGFSDLKKDRPGNWPSQWLVGWPVCQPTPCRENMADRFRTYCQRCGIPQCCLLTQGLKSFREVPDASIDFLFSKRST